MEKHQKKSIEALNDLIHICYDGIEGYRELGEKVENPQLKSNLLYLAQQRAEFASQLKDEVRNLGGEPVNEKDLKGKIHHIWIELKSRLPKITDKNMVGECIRAEEMTLKQYNNVLDKEIPAYVAEIIIDQGKKIENSLREVKKYREIYSGKVEENQ